MMKNCVFCNKCFIGNKNKKSCSEKCRMSLYTNSEKGKKTRIAYSSRPDIVEKIKSYKKMYRKRERIKVNKDGNDWNKRQRIKCLFAYSNGKMKCTCCHERNFEFLSLDHINNNGAEDRRLHGSSVAMMRYLIKNDFPPGYQVLCYNCNMSKGFLGYCPHKKND